MDDLQGRDDVLVYSLSAGREPPQTVAAFWSKSGHTWPAAWDVDDNHGAMADALGVVSFPANIVVGPQGQVLYARKGFDEARIRRFLGL